MLSERPGQNVNRLLITAHVSNIPLPAMSFSAWCACGSVMLADSGPSCEARFSVMLSLAWGFRVNSSDIAILCDLALRGTHRSLGWWRPFEL